MCDGTSKTTLSIYNVGGDGATVSNGLNKIRLAGFGAPRSVNKRLVRNFLNYKVSIVYDKSSITLTSVATPLFQ